MTKLALVVLAAAVAAGDAGAAVSVIGGGLAHACYRAVDDARAPARRALETCDLALEVEALSRADRAATLVNRGILHMRGGRNARALADFEAGLAIQPDLAEAKVNLGAALYNMGRFQEALSRLDEGVTATAPEARAVGHYNRALAREALGDVRGAYEDFRAALAIRADFDLAALQLQRFSVVSRGD